MAAETITTLIAPRVEFIAASSAGVIVDIYDTPQSRFAELCINAATWSALVTAMETPGTVYIPANYNSLRGDGSLNWAGQLSPEVWGGAS